MEGKKNCVGYDWCKYKNSNYQERQENSISKKTSGRNKHTSYTILLLLTKYEHPAQFRFDGLKIDSYLYSILIFRKEFVCNACNTQNFIFN